MANSSRSDNISLLDVTPHALTWERGLFICLMVPLSVAGFLGNLLIIATIFTVRDLRTTANAFLVNLAVSDLVLVIIVVPFNIASVVHGKVFWNDQMPLCIFVASICAPGCLTAIWSNTGVAFNRYYFMCHNDSYHKWFSVGKTIIWIVGIWTLSFAIHLPNHLGWGKNSYVEEFYLCTRETNLWSYSTFFASVGIVLPICISFYSYFNIYLLVRRSRSARNRIARKDRRSNSLSISDTGKGQPLVSVSQLSTSPTGRQTKVQRATRRSSVFYIELRLAQTLMQSFVVFLVSWLPLAILLMLPMLAVPTWIYLTTILLAHGSTMTNSVFFSTNDRFLKGVRELMSRIFPNSSRFSSSRSATLGSNSRRSETSDSRHG